jgi:hypothetical protein
VGVAVDPWLDHAATERVAGRFGPTGASRSVSASDMQRLHQLLPLESRDLRDSASGAAGRIGGDRLLTEQSEELAADDGVLSGHEDVPLQHIRQLAHVVTRPVIGHHGRLRLGSQHLERRPVLLCAHIRPVLRASGLSLNAPGTMAVNFPVADGGSFVVFASDYQNTEFLPGRTLMLTATFADGSTVTALTTVPRPRLHRREARSKETRYSVQSIAHFSRGPVTPTRSSEPGRSLSRLCQAGRLRGSGISSGRSRRVHETKLPDGALIGGVDPEHVPVFQDRPLVLRLRSVLIAAFQIAGLRGLQGIRLGGTRHDEQIIITTRANGEPQSIRI